MSKKYILIGQQYNTRIALPASLLEKIVEEGYLVGSTYADGKYTVSEVHPILSVDVVDLDEIRVAQSAQALKGTS